jgi:fluoride exporter
MLNSVLAISAGAALGALWRWALSSGLNALLPTLPPGTLLANLIGGYLIGVAAAVFVLHPGIGSEWRQFIVTGLLGGLTTFSTFSLEVAGLLQLQRFGWALAAILAHVAGSLLMTALGFASVWLLRRAT